jgi:hypothetical protein
MYMWKNVHFWLWNEQKGDFNSAEGNIRPSKKVSWIKETIVVIDAP